MVLYSAVSSPLDRSKRLTLSCGIYVHKARDVSAPIFFVLQLFANTACLFHLYQADGYCRCVIF